jgi:hypothetical protein
MISSFQLSSLFLLLLVVLLSCPGTAAASAARSSAASTFGRRTVLSRLMDNMLHVPDEIPDDVRINIVLNMEGF